jgi:hypothetical protein
MLGRDLLDERIARAEATLDAAAGSASLCTVSRSGTPMPGVKYPEGAWVALRDVRRSMTSAGGIEAALREVRQRWASDLAHHTAAGSGPDWLSYLTGGLDALDALAENVDSPNVDTPCS